MEKFDPDKATRVWQRVQNREPAEPLRQDHSVLIRMAGDQAALYRALARSSNPRHGERMGEFRRQQLRAVDCLRGICRLSGIPVGNGPAQPMSQVATLEKACRGEQRLVEAYCARMGDGEWGRVYAHLAGGAVQRCAVLLELLGTGNARG